jgi:hypothetical protein
MAHEGPLGQSRGGFAETTAADHRTIDTVFFHSNISEGNEIQGSQVGSHR